MGKETIVAENVSLAELKNISMGLDRAEAWDLYGEKDGTDRYECKRNMLVMNIDRNVMACIARKSYTVIQHRHAVESVVDALTSLNIRCEATLKASKHAIQLDVDFPDKFVELTKVNEKFTCGMRLSNDYSQQFGLLIAPRIKRLACSNGMIVVDIVKPKHIKWNEQLTVELQGLIDELIKDLINSDQKLQDVVSICMQDSVEWNTAKLLLQFMFKKKKHIKEIFARLPSQKDISKVTRWEMYNAVTDYATHGKRLRPEVDAWLHNKANQIIKNDFNKLCEIEMPRQTNDDESK